jgi:hypothetical protein
MRATVIVSIVLVAASLAILCSAANVSFPAGMTWQNIAWCPSGYNGECQSMKLVEPWQTAVDVDLFDTSAADMALLRSQGHVVICYFSAGTWEDWRPDADKFPKEVLRHKMESWAGEWWLDIFNDTHVAIIESLMAKRIELGISKGCQAFEPDNVDCYSNSDCILTEDHSAGRQKQLQYNKWIASTCHSNGGLVGLKNDVGQVADLVNDFDFAVNEQCQQYQECTSLLPFIHSNKAVFQVEYHGSVDAVCSQIVSQEGSPLFSVKVAVGGLWHDCGNSSSSSSSGSAAPSSSSSSGNN